MADSDRCVDDTTGVEEVLQVTTRGYFTPCIYIYNVTSIELKSSGTRAQKSNKTKSLIIFKSQGHTLLSTSWWP